LNGHPIAPNNPREAQQHGIGMVFQEQSLLPNMSVAENIYLGNESEFMRFGFMNWKRLNESARRQLEKVEAGNIDPSARTAELSFAERQMVELAKVLTLEERTDHHLLILLDEPTSVLERAEIAVLFNRVRGLKSRASFVFVSHRLDEVLELSDRVYVMKDGAVVAALNTDAGIEIHELHRLMVGRGLQAEYYRETQQQPYDDEVVLSVNKLTLDHTYQDISFDLHKGEILGIAGVIGSGREPLIRSLFGFVQPTAGAMRVAGAPVQFSRPSDAVAAGIGYIPRERRVEGLVLYLSVASNMTLASLPQVTQQGVIRHAQERDIARGWVDKLAIKTPGIDAMCLNLSGGNQQKVVLAKWITAGVKIMLLDHPTRGLDVGAKEEVYELVRELSRQGVAVVLTSDTLEETIGLSHTILVMRDGVITQRFDAPRGSKPEQVDIVEHMV
ncbi:MAG: sugar ABC transporter ATP-binding protein, partial [Chloroflexi bacterium]|nr:sugar ABC transporter ATP-binding protein [Chloroflexota bacterium]